MPIRRCLAPHGVQKFALCDNQVTRMRHQGKHHSTKSEPADSRDHPDESLHRLRSRFSRRLESFGLGEAQSPLLTDSVESVDADGNAR